MQPPLQGHSHEGGPTLARHRLFSVLCGTVLVAWCGWVSGFHRSTAPAEATWGLSLAAVVTVDLLLWRGRHHHRRGLRLDPVRDPWPRPGHRPHAALLGLSPWLGLSLIVLVWEILGIDTGPHEPHLTISALAQAYRVVNAALLLVWMGVGIGYGVARARAPAVPAPPRSSPERPGLAAATTILVRPAVMMPTPAPVPSLLLPANRGVGVGFWVAVVIAAVALDLIARRSEGRIADFEEMLRFITARPAPNVLVVMAWTFAGYHLFAR